MDSKIDISKVRGMTINSAQFKRHPNVKDYDSLIIGFNDTNICLQLDARGDCCSQSWFCCTDPSKSLDSLLDSSIDSILNTKISDIYVVEDSIIRLPKSNKQECDKNYLVCITFEYNIVYTDSGYDAESIYFQFMLRNSSNGYYSGWLETSYEYS